MKMAAHQTQRIPDVRELAPDTPAEFAVLLSAMTSPQPNERPRSFDELLDRLGRWSSRSRLRTFRKNFDGAVPHFRRAGKSPIDGRWPWIAACLFVTAGMVLTFADKGLQTELLAVTRRVADAIGSPVPAPGADASSQQPATTANPAQGLLPLPPVSSTGEIILADAGPYDAARVTATGTLTIRGAQGVNPVIQLSDKSLWLSADSVHLENIAVVCTPAAGQLPKAMLLVKSNRLTLERCEFRLTTAKTPAEDSASPPAAPQSTTIAWGPLDADATEFTDWQIDIQNTAFHGSVAALWMAECPAQLSLSNCLKRDNGVCLAISPKAAPHSCSIELTNLTLRDCGPLMRLMGPFAERPDLPSLEITSADCVFAPSAACPGLIELQTPKPRIDAARTVRVNGQGTVVTPGIALLSITDPSSGTPHIVDDADEHFEGLVISDVTFNAASGVANLTAPRSTSDAMPGVDTKRLPNRRGQLSTADRAH
jgi:hypothetical protein